MCCRKICWLQNWRGHIWCKYKIWRSSNNYCYTIGCGHNNLWFDFWVWTQYFSCFVVLMISRLLIHLVFIWCFFSIKCCCKKSLTCKHEKVGINLVFIWCDLWCLNYNVNCYNIDINFGGTTVNFYIKNKKTCVAGKYVDYKIEWVIFVANT